MIKCDQLPSAHDCWGAGAPKIFERGGVVLFRMLGPVEVQTEHGWSEVGAPKWRTVLAVLLLNPGQVVSTERLIGEVWPENPPARAVNLISVYVHRLRRLIGDAEGQVLVTRAPGYRIAVGPGDLDAGEFARLTAAGRGALTSGEPQRAAAALAEALSLWRGRALADVPTSPLIWAEASRLEESHLEAFELRIHADLGCGRQAQVVAEVRRLLADHQLREGLWALLMRALYASGRQAEALEVYARARTVIADELGVDPSAELQHLYQQMLTGDLPHGLRSTATEAAPDSPFAAGSAESPAGEPGPPAAPRADPFPPVAQLPADIPDFTGRAELVQDLRDLLSSPGRPGSPGAVVVAAVIGSGGLGKTTLAVHAAHLLRSYYPDGQLYVGLLGATQHPAPPSDVLARFLRDLGVDPARIPVDAEERAAQFRSRLTDRRVLIVLDDAKDAAQVRPLLPGSASSAVLVTTRSRMPDLAGSHVDLDVLGPDEARTMFASIVGAGRADAEPAATAEVLAACAGLPLAIRIAGARLVARGNWSVATIATRLSDERRRLDWLKTGDLAVRACFEVSFGSLPGPAPPDGIDPARAFRLLGVWPGPSIGLPAAAALLGEPADAVADALEVLVDAQLIQSPAADRYRFHDLLRVYAAERARADETGEARTAVIRRVLTWHLYTAEAAARIISPQHTRVQLDPEPPADVRPLEFTALDEALDWCEAERPGLIAATRLAAEAGLHDLAWQLPAAAMSFFYRRSHWGNWVATHQVGLASARQAGDRLAEAWMLNNLGMAYGLQRMAESVTCFEQALALYRELGDAQGEARAATNLASAYFDLRRYAEALEAAERSLVIQRWAGKSYGEGVTLGILSCAYRGLGRYGEAVDEAQQALAIFRGLGDQGAVADSLSDLGDAYLGLSRVSDAISCLEESLAIRRAIGDRYGQAATLRRLGQARRRDGEPAAARESLSLALGLLEELEDHAQAAEVRADLAAVAETEG